MPTPVPPMVSITTSLVNRQNPYGRQGYSNGYYHGLGNDGFSHCQQVPLSVVDMAGGAIEPSGAQQVENNVAQDHSAIENDESKLQTVDVLSSQADATEAVCAPTTRSARCKS